MRVDHPAAEIGRRGGADGAAENDHTESERTSSSRRLFLHDGSTPASHPAPRPRWGSAALPRGGIEDSRGGARRAPDDA
jgi:hypothetical protein